VYEAIGKGVELVDIVGYKVRDESEESKTDRDEKTKVSSCFPRTCPCCAKFARGPAGARDGAAPPGLDPGAVASRRREPCWDEGGAPPRAPRASRCRACVPTDCPRGCPRASRGSAGRDGRSSPRWGRCGHDYGHYRFGGGGPGTPGRRERRRREQLCAVVWPSSGCGVGAG
jgi:hypothetical protein